MENFEGEKMKEEEDANRKPKHKNPKFKESHDEEFCWEDEKEKQSRRRKLGKKSQWKDNTKEKW